MVNICQHCGKRVQSGESFILEGIYPTDGQIFSNTHYKNRAAPETYGTLYHKKCYEEQEQTTKSNAKQ